MTNVSPFFLSCRKLGCSPLRFGPTGCRFAVSPVRRTFCFEDTTLPRSLLSNPQHGHCTT